MIAAWQVAAVRAAEEIRLDQVPPGALMQRAAAGLAAATAAELARRRGRLAGARVVVLAGAGNNGGDALWAGARLAARGARVDAVLLSGRPHAEGLAALRAAGGRQVAAAGLEPDQALAGAGDLLRRADAVLDGVVGLGGSPGLREPAATLVGAIGPAALVVAVDLPSGVDPDTGQTPAAHVRADLTVTFGAAKPCLLLPPACRAAGRVHLVDIGLAPLLAGPPAVTRLEAADVAARWPIPGPLDDKYRRGVLGIVAGSATYTGAAVLATGGALRAGAGMIRYVGPDEPARLVRARWPEVVPGPGRVQAWAVGSGVDPEGDDGQPAAVRQALAGSGPVVVDAGALALVDPLHGGGRAATRVLTPHAGELARLLTRLTGDPVDPEQVQAQPLAHARRAARLTGATVLLKGATTIVATADGRARSQGEAPPWLATAGAGDVLAGVIGALLAAGLDPLDAASAGAFVHGRAAALAAGCAQPGVPGHPIVAGDVVDALPAAIAQLLAGT